MNTSKISSVPVTCVFVGNISEKVTNELIQSMLQECGVVSNWKRIQGSNGKYQAFGFCDFEHPEGTMRALRILDGFCIGGKKLTAEEKTIKMIQDFVQTQRHFKGLPRLPLKEGEMPKDEESLKDDERIRASIEQAVNEVDTRRRSHRKPSRNQRRRLVNAPNHRHPTRHPHHASGTASDRVPAVTARRVLHHLVMNPLDAERDLLDARPVASKHKLELVKLTIALQISSPLAFKLREQSQQLRQLLLARISQWKGRVTFSISFEKPRFRGQRRGVREKEESYRKRLEEWERRERRMAKQYAKEEEEEIRRKKNILKEAKKLRQFLEDYEDERDDPKYYKSSSLFQRRRDYEREREADAKDRQEEQQEIEELKKQILAENKNVEEAEVEAKKRHEAQEKAEMRRLRADSGSPTPHRPLGRTAAEKQELKTEAESSSEGGSPPEPNESKPPADDNWASVDRERAVKQEVKPPAAVPPPAKPSSSGGGKVLTTVKRETIEPKLNGVFDDEDEEDTMHVIKKKIKPFEITREERMQVMTPEERKKMIKELIDRIPTARDDLFAYTIDWSYVDESLVEQRVKPWVNKKITEYIGEEEPTLVGFVCENITSKAGNPPNPKKILSDLAMVLDDESEVFMVKMWRLIIYESEAKKLGLSSAANANAPGRS
ncbi:PWI domain-containing protein [Aphelenchoides avenae]|nr:PWI domain-containing protein [Aphelenchus avenae]